MNRRTALVASALSMILTTDCSMTHGSSKSPAKNPRPVKGYEVIATSHAPESWDSIESYIGYEIINRDCVPMDPFLGVQDVPNIGVVVKMIRVDDHTWKGHFFRDAWQDEDYYKLGICHWDVTSAGIAAIAGKVRFNWSHTLKTLLRDGVQTSYFRTNLYGDPAAVRSGAQALTAEDPEIFRNPDAYFPVTIAVRDASP